MEPPHGERRATSVPPLARQDWDRRDEEDLSPPVPQTRATQPPEDTFSSDSSDEEAPLLTEVHICVIAELP